MTDDGMILIEGVSEPQSRAASIGGGSFVAYSGPSPDKETGNEDSVALIPYGPDAAVLIVADGVGGMPAARRASDIAVRTLNDSLQSARSQDVELRTAIIDGIESANRAVLDLGTGSATTMTIVTVEGVTARTYQIGDSEAMIVGQRGVVRAQTLAHSPTGFAVEAGFLDEREALHHEERHLVSNLIGTVDMRIDMGAEVGLKPRDTILVASDGLTDNVHATEIANIVRKGPLEDAAASLSRLATHRMNIDSTSQPSKPDDLSIILFRKPYKPAVRRAAAKQS